MNKYAQLYFDEFNKQASSSAKDDKSDQDKINQFVEEYKKDPQKIDEEYHRQHKEESAEAKKNDKSIWKWLVDKKQKEELNKQAWAGMSTPASAASELIATVGLGRAAYRNLNDSYIKENRKNVPGIKILGLDTGITSPTNEQILQDNQKVDTIKSLIKTTGGTFALPAMAMTIDGVDQLEEHLKNRIPTKGIKNTILNVIKKGIKGRSALIGASALAATALGGVGLGKLYSNLNTKEYQ